MPRSIWTGSISFGLVNVPVRLHTAVRKQNVRFVQLHGPDHGRIRQRRVCEVDGAEVPYDELVKGYEIAPQKYVVVDPAELEAIDPEASRTIDIEDFVSLDQIDPLYYESGYYLGPANQAAVRPYRLLVEAMERTRQVGIARFVMRAKQYLAAIRAVDGVLVLSTMNYADEIMSRDEVRPEPVEVKERELQMAEQLIQSLSTDFDPARYPDTHRAKVLELIERKAEGQAVVEQPAAAAAPGRVTDLMSALEESLAAARKHRKKANGNGRPRKEGRSAAKRRGGGEHAR